MAANVESVLRLLVRTTASLRGGAPLPDAFVTATGVAPEAQLAMQAALQPYVDGAISKTIALPETFAREAYAPLYERAHALGLKGCTTFRAGTARGHVVAAAAGAAAPGSEDVERCCVVS